LILQKLNYRANLFYGDGYLGLKEEAPFDKILVTCGAIETPPLLLDQLKAGGVMVIPIGFKQQVMTVIIKQNGGKIKKIEYDNFQFVPFLRNKE
jgi:protein-L-isoaspartate(D-aspartate) O-methyltransferase